MFSAVCKKKQISLLHSNINLIRFRRTLKHTLLGVLDWRDDLVNAPIAQLDRAPDYESGGRGFESSSVHHQEIKTHLKKAALQSGFFCG